MRVREYPRQGAEVIFVDILEKESRELVARLAGTPIPTVFHRLNLTDINAVESFFSALTRQRIRRGSFHSIVNLQAAINRYLAERNAEPRPFVWTASAASILAKIARLPAASE